MSLILPCKRKIVEDEAQLESESKSVGQERAAS